MKTHNTLLLLICFSLFIITSCEDENKEKRINASLTSDYICKNFLKDGNDSLKLADSLSKVEYVYDENTKTLTLKHLNAGFNCCPDEFYCDVNLTNDTLLIKEREKEALCNCNCLYDLSIDVNNLKKKKYFVQFIEPYAQTLALLHFEIDLKNASSGSYSVVRKQYPWGMSSIY